MREIDEMRAKQVQFGVDSNWIKFDVDPKFLNILFFTHYCALSVPGRGYFDWDTFQA